jgi:hypothetical protein
MASSEVSEVTEVFTSFEEGLPGCDVTSLAQIEIESDDSPEGLDLGVASVQDVGDDLDVDHGSGIIYGEELIVSSEDVPQSEEIVGSESLGCVYDSIPVPSSSPSRVDLCDLMRKSSKGRTKTRRKLATDLLFESDGENASSKLRAAPTWQQKRVSIKTLEGEFSVTMWASGADDGKIYYFFSTMPVTFCYIVYTFFVAKRTFNSTGMTSYFLSMEKFEPFSAVI